MYGPGSPGSKDHVVTPEIFSSRVRGVALQPSSTWALQLLQLIVTDLYFSLPALSTILGPPHWSPVVSTTPLQSVIYIGTSGRRNDWNFVLFIHSSCWKQPGFLPPTARYYPFVEDCLPQYGPPVTRSVSSFTALDVCGDGRTKTSGRIPASFIASSGIFFAERNEWGFNWFAHFLGCF